MSLGCSFSIRFRPLTALALAALCVAMLFAACGGDDSGAVVIATDVSTPTHISTPTPTGPTPSPTPTPTPIAFTSVPTSGPTFPHNTVAPLPTPVDVLGDEKLYLALGDSLSAGTGASDPSRTSFVALITQALGDGYEVLDLGDSGATSDDLLSGQIDRAVNEIEARKSDGVPNNETAAITLEIGGNDLLGLYFDLVVTGKCPSVPEALQKQECVDGLRNVLNHYTSNLEQAIDQLQQADPDVPIFLATLYNPFSGGSTNLDQIGALALEGQAGTPFPDGLNDIIRQVGQEKGVAVVDWYPLFLSGVNTLISNDLIHPNDAGYALMAQAVLTAMHEKGLP